MLEENNKKPIAKRTTVELRDFSVDEITRTLNEIDDVSKVDFKIKKNIIIESTQENLLHRDRLDVDLKNSLLNIINNIKQFNKLFNYYKKLNADGGVVTIQSKDDIELLIAEMEKNIIRENVDDGDYTPEDQEINNFIINYNEYMENI